MKEAEEEQLAKTVEEWKMMAEKLRWRAKSAISHGRNNDYNMNMTAAGTLEMCAKHLDKIRNGN